MMPLRRCEVCDQEEVAHTQEVCMALRQRLLNLVDAVGCATAAWLLDPLEEAELHQASRLIDVLLRDGTLTGSRGYLRRARPQ